MKTLIVCVCAFFGALLVPPMFFPVLHNVVFHVGGIGFSWAMMIAMGVGFGALSKS